MKNKVLILDEKGHHDLNDQARDTYASFKQVFGRENFGIILPSDLEIEISGGPRAPNYFFDLKGSLYESGKGVSCDLFLGRSFTTEFGTLPTLGKIENILNYLDNERSKGNIGHLVNSRKGTINQKDKFIDGEINNLGIDTIESFYFKNFNDFEYFFENNGGNYIIKHRFGADGFDISQIDRNNLDKYINVDWNNYFVQKEVDIKSETRLVFLGNDFLGSRKIVSRKKPWETEAHSDYWRGGYEPSEKEIEDSRKIMSHLDIEMGSVDWVQVENEEKNFYLEVNGVATGLGREGYVYRLGRTVSEKLKNKYLL